MSLFYRRDRKEKGGEYSEEDDFAIIDLDQTGEWSRLDIEQELLHTGEETEREEIREETGNIHLMKEVTVDEVFVQELSREALKEEVLEEDLTEEELFIEEEADLDYISMEDDEEIEEEEELSYGWFSNIGNFLTSLTVMDKFLAAFGVLICMVGVITFALYMNDSGVKNQVEAMAAVGERLETVGILGKDKLLAVADAKKLMLEEVKLEEELNQEYREKEESKEIQVAMKMTSVQKDLKIKFVNKRNGKLVGNIPFEVEIIDGSEKKYNRIDEDKDGIIYLTDLDPGNYTVSMIELEEQEGITFSTNKEKIKVKEKISYEKIDVSDEIKDQSEVNSATEDTAKKDATEATLQNTVEWVESKKEAISTEETYTPINKDTIADPSLSASLGLDRSILNLRNQGIYLATIVPEGQMEILSDNEPTEEEPKEETPENEGEENGEDLKEETKEDPEGGDGGEEKDPSEDIKPDTDLIKGISLVGTTSTISAGESLTVTANLEKEGNPSYTLEWSSSANDLISTSQSGDSLVVTVAKEPEQDTQVTITAKAMEQTASFSFTIKGKPKEVIVPVAKIELNATNLTLEVDKTHELKATVLPENASDKSYTWSSSDSSIVKVEGGKLTALKAGTAKITVVSNADTAIKTECSVIVKAKAETTIQLNHSQVSMKVKEALQLKATVTPSDKTIKWSTSKAEVATVDNQGKVTAVAAGEAVITAEADGKKAECKITVKSDYDPKADTSKSLKDKGGNQVYVKTDGKYVEAKVADYYKHSEFYKKETVSGYRYYGWQNLDGKTYYFDKNGNKVTGEQVIQGAKYSFNSDGSLNTGSGVLGIDVSTWNGNINWSQVKNSGVSYVIIRTGFRGSTQGALVEDNKFRQNIKGALDAGLKVGVYFFTQAVNEVEAVEEASMVLSQIRGYHITYPVFIDVEDSGGRADNLDPGTRTKVINAFCQTIQNGGYRAGIYANKTWFNQKMNISALSGYKIWLAQYNTHVTYGGRYDMWQYSSTGSVAGISGKVDMNLSYLSY